MKAGNSFTIEPMINAGVVSDDKWPDDWTAVTVWFKTIILATYFRKMENVPLNLNRRFL